MKKGIQYPTSRIVCKAEKEGESIESKMFRVTNSNEPIDNTAPLLYTERKDGVLPQYDIRTDRWAMAMAAMDKVTKSNRAKRDAAPAAPAAPEAKAVTEINQPMGEA